MSVSETSTNTDEDGYITSGKWECANGITVELADNVLTISGNDEMGEDVRKVIAKTICRSDRYEVKCVISNGVTSIGYEAFYGCSSLSSIEIPNSVTYIGYGAFYDCSSLSSIEIPSSVTRINLYPYYHNGHSVFGGCYSLSTIKVAPENKVYDSRDNCNAIIETETDKLIVGCSNTKIPNNVTSIGYGAFNGCSGLSSIAIPNDVTSIEAYAFNDCDNLNSITIPNGVTSIEAYVFSGCRSLSSIEIPDGVTSIGYGAFNDCSSLSSIEIPSSVTSIDNMYDGLGEGEYGESVFSGCSSLSSIKVSPENKVYDSRENCNTIISGNTLIVGCSNTKIPNGVTKIDYCAFNGSSLSSIEIPNSVISIGNYAFGYCNKLSGIEIPSSVTSIGNYVLDNCENLKKFVNNSTEEYSLSGINHTESSYGTRCEWRLENTLTVIKSVGSGQTAILEEMDASNKYGGFVNCLKWESENGITVELADNVLTISGNGELGEDVEKAIAETICRSSKYKVKCVINNGITSIGPHIFRDCRGLNSVEIPNSVTSIGWQAFANCSNLSSIKIPSGVTSIERGTFSGCRGLNSVEIPDSVTSIDYAAFGNCINLTSIEIPNSVISIENQAFGGCSNLRSIEIPSSVTSIGKDAFTGCSGLNNVKVALENKVYDSRDNCNAIIETKKNELITGCSNTKIPSDVTKIGVSAFSGRSGLTSIEIPNSVTYINSYAFENCKNLIYIRIPNSVKTIGWYAFQGCSSLNSIEIPSSVNYIEQSAFMDCTNLTNVKIQNGVKKINAYAFRGCSSLNSIEIPNSVTHIERAAFSGCSSLNNIEIPSSVISIEIDKDSRQNTFFNCSSLNSIKVSPENKVYDSRDNCNAIIKTETNELIAGSNSTKIPEGVTSIEREAFYGRSGLMDIEIPSSVTSIGKDAFTGCSGLNNVKVSPENKVYDSRDNCNAIIETETNKLIVGSNHAKIPEGVTSVGKEAFLGCSSLTDIEIPSSVTNIEENAFTSCSGLNSIKVSPENKVYDGRDNCNAIIETKTNKLITGCGSTKIPKSVKSIGDNAFKDCDSLSSIEFSRVVSIGDNAFTGCSHLSSIEVLDYGIIANNAFTNCSSLNSIKVRWRNGSPHVYYSKDNNNAIIGKYRDNLNKLIVGCGSTKIPDNVTRINDEAFRGCDSLSSIEIPNSVIYIGNYAFEGCSNLSSIEIPSSTNQIEINAFNNCDNLKKFTNNSCCAYELDKIHTTGQWYLENTDIVVTSIANGQTAVYKENEADQPIDNIKYGDINSDGEINIQDGVLLKKHLAGIKEIDVCMDASDVNVDGSVDISDAVILMKYLAGMNVTMGK